MKLTTLLLTSTLTFASCASPQSPLSAFQQSPLEEALGIQFERQPVKSKIQALIDYQREQDDYQTRKPVSSYDHGFEIAGHTFGTKLCYDEENGYPTYFSVFADNLFVGDIAGDGPNYGEVFFGNFHPIKGNKGNVAITLIPNDNPYLFFLQDAILDILVENYLTGTVSPENIQTYETIRRDLLMSLGS